MTESFVENVIGSGREDQEGFVPEVTPVGSDQTATALALEQQGTKSPEVEQETVAYLKKQSQVLEKQGRMLDLQMEHLHEQRALNLRHLRFRRWRESLQIGVQVFLILTATVIGLGVAIILYDAFTSKSVVVNAFKAPPALAVRGFTGDVVASRVLDDLQKLQGATRSGEKGLNTRSAWASDIKIEVPETGVSIGEISRLLHERFGRDLHIDGDLIQTEAGGLELTVKGDGVPARAFVGTTGDFDKLATQAAEYIYGRSQPRQYATYLEDADRYADAIAFLPSAFDSAATQRERAVLANTWGNAYAGLNKPAQAVEKFRLAMRLAPVKKIWWTAWSNLVSEMPAAQGEEAGWRESQAFLRAAAQAPERDRPQLRLLSFPAQVTWDLPLVLASNLAEAAQNGGAGASTSPVAPAIADTYALMHDAGLAASYMAASDPDAAATKAEAELLRAYAALDRGDPGAAVAPLEAFQQAWSADSALRDTYWDAPCYLGLAYGLAGRMAEAEAVFKRTGPWSRCYAFHGDVLAHAGDMVGAERVWAVGLKVAPDLPMIYLHRGVWELNRGDLKSAQVDLATASAKAPHLADPLKAWGALLAREGRWKDALAKYTAALNDAPAWAELRQARDAAARRG